MMHNVAGHVNGVDKSAEEEGAINVAIVGMTKIGK